MEIFLNVRRKRVLPKGIGKRAERRAERKGGKKPDAKAAACLKKIRQKPLTLVGREGLS